MGAHEVDPGAGLRECGPDLAEPATVEIVDNEYTHLAIRSGNLRK
jgi:hypothetical protein